MNNIFENGLMRLLFCRILISGVAFAGAASGSTNDVNRAKAKEAMSVLEADKSVEDAEVAETTRIAARSTNTVAVTKEGKTGFLKKYIKIDEPQEKVDPWNAFVPPSDSEFDWIQLTSGEWLKGDFKVLYEYEVEFDSDEMGLQTFDIEDVKRMRTRGMKTVFIQGDEGARDTEILRGMLEITDDDVVLRRAEYEVTVPRDRVISIAGGRQKERDNWSGMISLGVNARGGNTKTTDTTIIANVKRRTAASRFAADYLANYSKSGELKTANNQRLNANYDRFLTAQFFWQVLAGEYYRDPFSNIAGQYSLSSGVGYDVIHSSKIEWSLELGVGYQDQQFVSVAAGKNERTSSPFATFGMVYDQEINGYLDYIFDYSMRWLNKENGTYTHHMLTTFSFDLISDLDLDISVVWDRIETPEAAADGTVPDKDDYQLILSLAYDF
jgi:putative salt-induced outer membrane protein YdiY